MLLELELTLEAERDGEELAEEGSEELEAEADELAELAGGGVAEAGSEADAEVGRLDGTSSRAAPASGGFDGMPKLDFQATRTVVRVKQPLGRGRGEAAGEPLGVAAYGMGIGKLKERQSYESKGEGAVQGEHGGQRAGETAMRLPALEVL